MSAAMEERQILSKLFNLKPSPLEISISQKKAGSGLKVFKYTQIDKKWNVYLYKEDLKIAPLLSRTFGTKMTANLYLVSRETVTARVGEQKFIE